MVNATKITSVLINLVSKQKENDAKQIPKVRFQEHSEMLPPQEESNGKFTNQKTTSADKGW